MSMAGTKPLEGKPWQPRQILDRNSLQRLDLVVVYSRRIIVTGHNPNRPANCWRGVLENGKGKEYIFGPRHMPEKVGVVTENHPALQANKQRTDERSGHGDLFENALNDLMNAVDAGDIHKARSFVDMIREIRRN